jgi:DNA-binding CsgD family transcriptional regulator
MSPKPILISKREYQILEYLIQDYSNKRLALELEISVRTVEVHRRNLLNKTGSEGLAGLVKFAIREGLLPEYSFSDKKIKA